MQRGYTARLYPSKEQLNILNKAFGATRFVYNYFLAERIRSYKEDGVSLTRKWRKALCFSYGDISHTFVGDTLLSVIKQYIEDQKNM